MSRKIFKEQIRRNNTVLKGQRRFHQARHSSCSLGVSDNCLNRTAVQWLAKVGIVVCINPEEGVMYCLGLDRVSRRGSSTVSLEVLWSIRRLSEVKASLSVCAFDQCFLRCCTWYSETFRSPILIQAGFYNDTFDIVTVGYRSAQSFQYNSCYTFTTGISVSTADNVSNMKRLTGARSSSPIPHV